MLTTLVATDDKYRRIIEIANATGIDRETLEAIYDGAAQSAPISVLLKLNDYFQSQSPKKSINNGN